MVAQSRRFFNGCSKLSKKLSFLWENKLYQSIQITSNIKRETYWYRFYQDGRGKMSNELNYILKALELIKMKKDGQYEEKIIQICKQEFGFSVKEVLDSLKEGIERNVLKKVYKNNKSSYRILKELVVEDKQDVVRGKEGEKNICNSISYGTEEATTTTINMGSQTDMISSREFQDFKAESSAGNR